MLTGDEEVGGFNGTKHLMEKTKMRPQFVISAEPTRLKIGNTAKGIIRLKLTARGKSAHAAKPWEGSNAINKMVAGLSKLSAAFPSPEKSTPATTCSISTISGGDAVNKVPESCQANLDIRYAPDDPPDKIIREIKSKCRGIDAKSLSVEPAASCAPDNKFVASLLNSIKKTTGKTGELITKEAASDVRFFTAVGIPGVVFGPGGGGSHSANEWVDLNSLFIFYEILEDFILANINW